MWCVSCQHNRSFSNTSDKPVGGTLIINFGFVSSVNIISQLLNEDASNTVYSMHIDILIYSKICVECEIIIIIILSKNMYIIIKHYCSPASLVCTLKPNLISAEGPGGSRGSRGPQQTKNTKC